MKTIDCRGLACPGPVIQAKRALEEMPPGGSFSLVVDSEAGRENVRRFAETRGASVRVEEEPGGVFRLVVTGAYESAGKETPPPPVVFISSDRLGSGDDRLGVILMEGFVTTLLEQDTTPDRILLMNGGVRLAAEGSPVVPALKTLTDRGCELLVCGTCLAFFDLTEKLAVGSVSNMFDIQGALLTASSVIRP